MLKVKITGLGSYLPKKVLTNKDLEKMVDTSDEWISTRTGIKERRIASKDETSADMGYKAAKVALKDANVDAEDIDYILVATLTPDYVFPSTACLIQAKLNAKAAALDIQAACSGFVYALNLAKSLIESGSHKNILIVATEKLSSIVNYKDRSTAILFGDAAAAAVVSSKGKGLEIQSTYLKADGSQSDLLILPAGGSKHPASLKTVQENKHYLQMQGKDVYKHAVKK